MIDIQKDKLTCMDAARLIVQMCAYLIRYLTYVQMTFK